MGRKKKKKKKKRPLEALSSTRTFNGAEGLLNSGLHSAVRQKPREGVLLNSSPVTMGRAAATKGSSVHSHWEKTQLLYGKLCYFDGLFFISLEFISLWNLRAIFSVDII